MSCLCLTVDTLSIAEDYHILHASVVNAVFLTSKAVSLRHCAVICSRNYYQYGADVCMTASFNLVTKDCMFSNDGLEGIVYTGDTDYKTVVQVLGM